MAPRKPSQRSSVGTGAASALAGRWERRWARMRLWFRRHARENVVLAIVATIGACLSRPFKRFRARDKLISGGLILGVLVVLAVAFLSGRSGAGTERVRADEPPTTAEANRAMAPPTDTTPPPLLLDPTLTDGLAVGTNHLVVSGMTDPNARVVIAELEVMADGDGAFSAEIPLLLGPNRIDVVATDETGNATGFAFNVVYVVDAPPPPPKQAPKRVVSTTTSTVRPPPTTGATTTAKRDPTAGDKTTTTLASTTAVSATAGSTTTTTTSVGGIMFPTTAADSTTQAATTTQATTTTEVTTTVADTTPTTEGPTTTQPPDTTAAVPTSDPSPTTTA